MPLYDKFGVPGNCRGCGAKTFWHIDGAYPICPRCMRELVLSVKNMVEQGFLSFDEEADANDTIGMLYSDIGILHNKIAELKKKIRELDDRIEELEMNFERLESKVEDAILKEAEA